MESNATLTMKGRGVPPIAFAAVIWLVSYFGACRALDEWKPAPPWDIAVAAVPLAAFLWFGWLVRRALREFDELQRRIHLEALALAFLTTMLGMMGMGMLEPTPRGAVTLPWRHLWLALLPLYGICYAVVSRRYR